MNTTQEIQPVPPAAVIPTPDAASLMRVVGVGNAGASIVAELIRRGFAGAHCALAHGAAATAGEVTAGLKVDLTAGRIPGSTGTLGEAPATAVRAFCEGAGLVCVIAGLGGRTATESAPAIAREARAAGATVLAVVTLPFECEGSLRQARADWGLDQLCAVADGVLCLPNQLVFPLIDENTRLAETFAIPTQLLAGGVMGLWRMLTKPAQFRVHLEDVCALLPARPGRSAFAVAEATGASRATDAVERLIAHPLLAGGSGLRECGAVLVNVAGGPDMTMAEVNRVMEPLNRHCEKTNVILATSIDESLRERIVLTLLASTASELAGPVRGAKRGSTDSGLLPAPELTDLGEQLLPAAPQPRPASRLVPPAPEMSPEDMQRLLAKQDSAAGRRRKPGVRPRQTQLQLEIVSKGRFDKSEPTIHKGEDLDLPTYVRRGVVLN